MSDHPNAAASLGEQLGLGRCLGTSWCECSAHAEEPSGGDSPSEFRSRRSSEEGSGDSSDKSDEYYIAHSEVFYRLHQIRFAT
jgi:hypothetical protein